MMYLRGVWPYWAFVSTSNPFVLHKKTFLHYSGWRTPTERFVEAAALQTGRAVREVFSLLILKTVVQTWHRSDKLLALHAGVELLQQPGGLLVYIALLPPRAHCLSTDPGHQKHLRGTLLSDLSQSGNLPPAGWVGGSLTALLGCAAELQKLAKTFKCDLYRRPCGLQPLWIWRLDYTNITV